MATGGSIESVGIAGRTFSVAADADSDRDLGGFSNEAQPNGDGTARNIKTRKPWKVGGLALNIDDLAGDQEFLQDVADGDYVPMDITYVSGAVYSGLGIISGDLTVSSQSTTGVVELSGPQKLTKQ